jgi:hypothetical protein
METPFANLPLWRKSLHHDARRGLVHSLQRRIDWTV